MQHHDDLFVEGFAHIVGQMGRRQQLVELGECQVEVDARRARQGHIATHTRSGGGGVFDVDISQGILSQNHETVALRVGIVALLFLVGGA